MEGCKNQLILNNAGKADLISNVFNTAHSVTYNDLSDPATESAVNGATTIVNYLKPEVRDSELPSLR